ncbi:c-type cytochrome [Reyranella sp.]|uniref:c-type cytochrome n=1 Tax=Reyranella sp. TaxID=1929291 RepID=UPI003BABE78A
MRINGAALGFAVAAIAGLTLAFIGHPAVQLPAPPPAPAAVASSGATAFVLKSVSVDLPTSTEVFPGGATAETINANCLSCHSAGMVLTQPNLPKATWHGIVDKMIHAYKAPVDAGEMTAIVDYLATTKGPK